MRAKPIATGEFIRNNKRSWLGMHSHSPCHENPLIHVTMPHIVPYTERVRESAHNCDAANRGAGQIYELHLSQNEATRKGAKMLKHLTCPVRHSSNRLLSGEFRKHPDCHDCLGCLTFSNATDISTRKPGNRRLAPAIKFSWAWIEHGFSGKCVELQNKPTVPSCLIRSMMHQRWSCSGTLKELKHRCLH